jgi:hypothetical protein
VCGASGEFFPDTRCVKSTHSKFQFYKLKFWII